MDNRDFSMAAAPPRTYAADQSSFTEQEWRLLQFGPFWVMTQVGAADGKIDTKEMVALGRVMDSAAQYKHPLVRQVLADSAGKFEELWQAFGADNRDVRQGLTDVTALLDRKLPPADALSFKVALLGIAHGVADASGGFLGLGNRVSDEEGQALALVMEFLGITAADVDACE